VIAVKCGNPLSSLGTGSIKTEFSLVNNPLTGEEGGCAKLFNLAL
jgi:hypothetical protein